MAKPKNPLLSLGAKGTIGDTLTFQKRGQGTIARKKPIPANPQSLAQMYHRWLYQDYAYLWRQQSQATQQEYRSEGAKRHLTGFSHWMSEQLSYLPDIAAMWHLDEPSGAIAYDYSRNHNHGNIFGPSPTHGFVAGAFSFDGINDYVDCGNGLSLDVTTTLTIEALVRKDAPCDGTILSRDDSFARNYVLYFDNFNRLVFPIWQGNVLFLISGNTVLNIGNVYHFCCTYDGVNLRAFIDGLPDAPPVPFTGPIDNDDVSLQIGQQQGFGGQRRFHGVIDNVLIYNRALDANEILRHSERRYPL